MVRPISSSTSAEQRGRGPANAPTQSTGGPQQAFVLVLRWLAGRELSTAQIRDRLTRRGFDRAAIEAVVERMIRETVVDDRRAALSVARVARDVKRHGPHRVRRDLEARGIPRELAREVVAETFADADAPALVEKALARRLRSTIKSPAEFRRLYQYLSRQGFPSPLIVSTLKAHRKRGTDTGNDD